MNELPPTAFRIDRFGFSFIFISRLICISILEIQLLCGKTGLPQNIICFHRLEYNLAIFTCSVFHVAVVSLIVIISWWLTPNSSKMQCSLVASVSYSETHQWLSTKLLFLSFLFFYRNHIQIRRACVSCRVVFLNCVTVKLLSLFNLNLNGN